MSENKVVFSVYLDEKLRRRLLTRATELQRKLGRRVSINSIVVEAIETYLEEGRRGSRKPKEKSGREAPNGEPPEVGEYGFVDPPKED